MKMSSTRTSSTPCRLTRYSHRNAMVSAICVIFGIHASSGFTTNPVGKIIVHTPFRPSIDSKSSSRIVSSIVTSDLDLDRSTRSSFPIALSIQHQEERSDEKETENRVTVTTEEDSVVRQRWWKFLRSGPIISRKQRKRMSRAVKLMLVATGTWARPVVSPPPALAQFTPMIRERQYQKRKDKKTGRSLELEMAQNYRDREGTRRMMEYEAFKKKVVEEKGPAALSEASKEYFAARKQARDAKAAERKALIERLICDDYIDPFLSVRGRAIMFKFDYDVDLYQVTGSAQYSENIQKMRDPAGFAAKRKSIDDLEKQNVLSLFKEGKTREEVVAHYVERFESMPTKEGMKQKNSDEFMEKYRKKREEYLAEKQAKKEAKLKAREEKKAKKQKQKQAAVKVEDAADKTVEGAEAGSDAESAVEGEETTAVPVEVPVEADKESTGSTKESKKQRGGKKAAMAATATATGMAAGATAIASTATGFVTPPSPGKAAGVGIEVLTKSKAVTVTEDPTDAGTDTATATADPTAIDTETTETSPGNGDVPLVSSDTAISTDLPSSSTTTSSPTTYTKENPLLKVLPAATAVGVVGGGGWAFQYLRNQRAEQEEERKRQFKLIMGIEDEDTMTGSKDAIDVLDIDTAPSQTSPSTLSGDDISSLTDDDDDDDDDEDTTPSPVVASPSPPSSEAKKEKASSSSSPLRGVFRKKKNTAGRETDLKKLLAADARAPAFAGTLAGMLAVGAPGRFPDVPPYPGTFDLNDASSQLRMARDEAGLADTEAAELFANVVHCMLIDIVDLASSTLGGKKGKSSKKADKMTVDALNVVLDFMDHGASLFDAVASGVTITPVTYGGKLSKSKLENMFGTYAGSLLTGIMSLATGETEGDDDASSSGPTPTTSTTTEDRVDILQQVFGITDKKAEGITQKIMMKSMMSALKDAGKGGEGGGGGALAEMLQGMGGAAGAGAGGMPGMADFMGGGGAPPTQEEIKESLSMMKQLVESGSIGKEELAQVRQQFTEAYGADLSELIAAADDPTVAAELGEDGRELLEIFKTVMQD